ncbi:MAG TPA: glucose-1-phosphate cytidylyltransferase [Blastocatellia bacterium]|nr:glucose-1-phosphate cytidylyltransferase [Blastocatellia bacterium]
MKTVILCGGRGTRLSEHGASVPKALIEIGGRPLLWHLLKIYQHHGLNDFVLCLGYLGDSIKRYFLDHHWLASDFTLKTNRNGEYQLHRHGVSGEDWQITFAETGLDTNTGGRVKQIERYLGEDPTVCVTYGDGLANIDLPALIEFHRSHGKLATLTAVHPRSTFGLLKLTPGGAVNEFEEKPIIQDWSNGGFFVFNRPVFSYLTDNCVLEREPLERLAQAGELMAYRHTGFWKCLDTYKDNVEFNQLWDTGQAEWKLWK